MCALRFGKISCMIGSVSVKERALISYRLSRPEGLAYAFLDFSCLPADQYFVCRFFSGYFLSFAPAFSRRRSRHIPGPTLLPLFDEPTLVYEVF